MPCTLSQKESDRVERTSLGVGQVSEADRLPSTIDGRRSVPCHTSIKVTDVDRGSVFVFPEHGVLSARASNCIRAETGNADDLAFVIDRGCG